MGVRNIPECNLSDTKPNWQPEWLIEDKHGCQCGIMMDDRCYVVLCQDWNGNWIPPSHIPINVAKFLGELVH